MTFKLISELVDLSEEKKVSNAFGGYLSPFRVNHSWVDDARGHSVCEAQNSATAKEIAKLLNTAYPVKA